MEISRLRGLEAYEKAERINLKLSRK